MKYVYCKLIESLALSKKLYFSETSALSQLACNFSGLLQKCLCNFRLIRKYFFFPPSAFDLPPPFFPDLLQQV